MSDEQNIPGVPEGWRIHHVEIARGHVIGEAHIERIPKPKRPYLIVELPVESSLDLPGARDVITWETAWMLQQLHPLCSRIEERDT